MKTNKQGFAPLQIVLLLVLALGVIGTGWYVLQAKDKTNKSLDNSSNAKSDSTPVSTNKEEPKVSKEEDSWFLYESPAKEYTISLADGWELERYQKSPSTYTWNFKSLGLVAGKKATVTEVEGGRDGAGGLFINYATQNLDQIYKPGEKQTTLKTNDGLDIEKYYDIRAEEQDGISLSKGSKTYSYIIYKDKQAMSISYSFEPDATDYHELVERVVRTVHFNK